jgi:myo-inositol-1(or 4)-monophosphatase
MPMHNDRWPSLLKIASQAALTAGEFLSQNPDVSRKIKGEFNHDIKIEADRQSEGILLDFLKKESHLPVFSEEAGGVISNALTWIVDPIDGTLNFQRQIPLCCISIGLWEKDKPVLGVIYDFYRRELFAGIVGVGAWLNEKPMSVSPTLVKEKAILFTGFPAASDFTTEGLLPLVTQVQSFRKLRWIGSAALSLAYVASGRGDAYHERHTMLWDVAAGMALVLAAGGSCQYEKKDCGYNVFASNGLIKSL